MSARSLFRSFGLCVDVYSSQMSRKLNLTGIQEEEEFRKERYRLGRSWVEYIMTLS